MKITKDSNDIAAYAYDAQGRRVRKSDFVADSNTYYYNNTSWQVLAEYSGAGTLKYSYVYGNYIDEAVRTSDRLGNDYYYAHDHLYSPAANSLTSGLVSFSAIH